MFLASKIFWFLVQPSSLLLEALLVGVWLSARGRVAAGLRWQLASIVGMLVIGLTSVTDLITAPLEARFPRPALDGQTIAGIIVLGGAEDPGGGSRELMSLNEAGERMTESAALALRFPTAKLVFSGGSGALFQAEPSAAEHAAALYRALGIAANRILLENRSRTTHENALLSLALVKPEPAERWVLVTSAWHMPRAIGTFRKAGFDVIAWPVDYRTSGRFSPSRIFGSVPDGLRRLDTMSKEYLGLLAYWLTGRTSALFPAP